MEFPNLFTVKEKLSAIVKNVDSLIETIKTNDKMTFSEYSAQLGRINSELAEMETKIQGLIASDTISKLRNEGTFKENKRAR
jgi:hypothetical protein